MPAKGAGRWSRVAVTERVPPRFAAVVRTVIGVLLPGVLALTVVPKSGLAQATLRGRVVDSETGRMVSGAKVTIRGNSASITTDSLGQFEATELPAGDAQIRIQRLGYAPGDFKIRVPPSGDMDRVFSLDFTGQLLPTVEVQAYAERLMPRYSDFEQRRQRGLGAFFRWDELNKEAFGSVGDALRTVRGVRIRCNQQTFECFAGMVRAPNCPPTWFIDGQEVKSFHENTPIRDVYGIEVYRGPGEIPAEFGGSDAACGVIVMWTKSRPYRSTP